MHNFAQARKNMLDCQLATNGIIEPGVLDVFKSVPRELFLPEDKRGAAYVDEDILLAPGAFCMEPVVHARMVQAANPGIDDAVLNIGDVTGYSSAILSGLVSTVVALESKVGTLDKARGVWDAHDYCNVAVVKGAEAEGSKEHAPYDLIFINGAVAEIPQNLLEQLGEKGRLVTVVKKPGHVMGCITVAERVDGENFSTRTLFDAATPYVSGLEPASNFSFE